MSWLPDPRVLEPFAFGVFAGVFTVLLWQCFTQHLEYRRHKKLMKNASYSFRHNQIAAEQYNLRKLMGDK